jgi:hypothetical protein
VVPTEVKNPGLVEIPISLQKRKSEKTRVSRKGSFATGSARHGLGKEQERWEPAERPRRSGRGRDFGNFIPHAISRLGPISRTGNLALGKGNEKR